MANLPDLVGPLTDTVRVTVTGDPGVLGDVNIELSVQYPPNQTNITTGQTATIVARISDIDDTPLSGVIVNFSTTLGTISGANGTFNPARVPTDAAGIAKATLSSLIPGVATVYVNVDIVGGSSEEKVETVEIIDAVDSLVVSVPAPRTITLGDGGTADATLNASAVVRDEDGAFLKDVVVSFSLVTTCNNVAFTPLSTSAITDQGGLAVYEIQATASAVESCTYTVRGATTGGVEDTETGTITVQQVASPPTPVPTPTP
jgi:adhesin/invasin